MSSAPVSPLTSVSAHQCLLSPVSPLTSVSAHQCLLSPVSPLTSVSSHQCLLSPVSPLTSVSSHQCLLSPVSPLTSVSTHQCLLSPVSPLTTLLSTEAATQSLLLFTDSYLLQIEVFHQQKLKASVSKGYTWIANKELHSLTSPQPIHSIHVSTHTRLYRRQYLTLGVYGITQKDVHYNVILKFICIQYNCQCTYYSYCTIVI